MYCIPVKNRMKFISLKVQNPLSILSKAHALPSMAIFCSPAQSIVWCHTVSVYSVSLGPGAGRELEDGIRFPTHLLTCQFSEPGSSQLYAYYEGALRDHMEI